MVKIDNVRIRELIFVVIWVVSTYQAFISGWTAQKCDAKPSNSTYRRPGNCLRNKIFTVKHQNKTPPSLPRSNLLEKGLISTPCYFYVTLAGLRDLDFLNIFTTLVLNEARFSGSKKGLI